MWFCLLAIIPYTHLQAISTTLLILFTKWARFDHPCYRDRYTAIISSGVNPGILNCPPPDFIQKLQKFKHISGMNLCEREWRELSVEKELFGRNYGNGMENLCSDLLIGQTLPWCTIGKCQGLHGIMADLPGKGALWEWLFHFMFLLKRRLIPLDYSLMLEGCFWLLAFAFLYLACS